MTLDYALAGLATAVLIVYLGWALLKPEAF